MNKKLHWIGLILLLISYSFNLKSQIISGPMVGYVEHRTAKIWVEVKYDSKVSLKYWQQNLNSSAQIAFLTHNKQFNFHTIIFDCVNMNPGSIYEFEIYYSNKPSGIRGKFKTQELWKWRKAAPDFSFLTGSCAYLNEPEFDRPTPYGGDTSIFNSMAKENSEFMLWLGDNWYTREVDYGSQWGLWYRASRDRSLPSIQNFTNSIPQVAIWDDHDYGPNNEGVSYIFKNETREVFSAFWANPTYGLDQKGVYSKASYYDVDIFLMDNRTWRSSDDMISYIDEKPNPDKKMFGNEQLNWLKNALLNSHATFKIIATGSPMLNRMNKYDCFVNYPIEHQELLRFLELHNIKGVLFITGDRHHNEIIEEKRVNKYSLYDLTLSPLTSGVYKLPNEELANPALVNGSVYQEQNYTRISVLGKTKDRKLKIEYMDKTGTPRFSWEINESQLK